MDEAQEHAGVHAHRAGGVEQHDQPQRLFLALALDEADRHAAMADIAVDGPSQIEPVAAPPRQIAAGQPRAHDLRQPRRGGVGLFDLVGIGQFAEIDLGQIVGARGAFHAAFAGAILGRLVGGRNLVGRGFASGAFGSESCRLFSDGLLAAFAEPMVIDRDLTRRPSQNASNSPSNLSQSDFRAENRCLNATRNRPGLFGIARRHQGGGVAAFMQADGEGVVAQGLEKRRELSPRRGARPRRSPHSPGLAPQQLMRPSPADVRSPRASRATCPHGS